MKKVLALALILSMMLSMTATLSGCGSAQAADLMSGVQANEVAEVELTSNTAAVTDFGVRLFQQSLSAEDTLVSPLSVLCALAMTANGAKGETLAQVEEVFGLSVGELNSYLHTYMEQLPNEKDYKLSMANSIWFTEDSRFTVEQNFLQTNADYYGAAIYRSPFDQSTVKEINGWVEQNTDGMIDEVIESIPPNAVMYLINALAFEAKWKEEYKERQIRDGIFTEENGERDEVEFMYSEENLYLEDELATGFIKYYKDNSYAFVALLPNEGVTVADYAASLTGAHLNEMLANVQEVTVNAAIPKFESEYEIEMSEILKRMGMTDAFDELTADLSGLGSSATGNLFISQVLHKTFIEVDEQGTKAAATTVVTVSDCAMAEPIETKTVILDRPFVYLLIDCETGLPFFIGTVMEADD